MEKRGSTLSVSQAGEIILQALAGLEYAHNIYGPGSGLVHRDLKPHNFFLTGSERERMAKVGDYGLSKAFDMAGLSGHTRTGAIMGTLAFMPRQQLINFKFVKPEVDVWAMAASLYYMLTGRPPRDFPEGTDPLLVILQTNAVPIRQRLPSIPKKLANVIDLALVDRPGIHFKTAAEFKRALESVL